MKKNVLTFAILFSFIIFSNAQVSFSLLPKVGASFCQSRMGANNYHDSKMKVGLVAGIGLPISLSNYFDIQPEFYYIQKNSRYTYNGDNGSSNLVTTSVLDQYELPVLLKGKFDSFYVSAGPSIAFNANGHSEVNKVKTNFAFGNAVTELKKVAWSAQFGLGYNFDIGSGKLNVDARYGLGLSDMDNILGTKNTTKLDAMAFTMGYLFPIGKK